MLLPVLLSLAVCAEHYFIQFADMHIEEHYKAGSNVLKRCVEGEGNAPEVGYVGCDLSDKAVKMYIEGIKELYPDPEFIVYTGDSSPHFVDTSFASMYTREDVIHYAELGLKLIREVYPDTLIIPVMGNHDNFPSDQITDNEESMAHLNTIADIFANYIPESELATFREHGYYYHDLTDKIRILVMTSVYCDLVNFYATFTGGEKDLGTFDGVRDVLEQSRAEGKKVMFMFHRPAGVTETSTKFADYLPVCRDKLRQIYIDYADVLTYGSFNGHTHKHSFRLFMDDDFKPIHAQFVSIPLTTYSSQQPGNSIYYYDDEKDIIKDSTECYMDMDESNEANKAIIKCFPSFVEAFHIPDMTPASMYEVYKHNVAEKDSPEMQDFYARSHANYSRAHEFDNKYWASHACGSGPVDKEVYNDCVDHLEKGEPYIVE